MSTRYAFSGEDVTSRNQDPLSGSPEMGVFCRPDSRHLSESKAKLENELDQRPMGPGGPAVRVCSKPSGEGGSRAMPEPVDESPGVKVRGPAPAWLRTGRPALHRLTANRRQALVALGGGAVALATVGSATAVAFGSPGADDGRGKGGGNVSPRDAGSFADRDASYGSGLGDLHDLGAAGLADTPSQAAAAAL